MQVVLEKTLLRGHCTILTWCFGVFSDDEDEIQSKPDKAELQNTLRTLTSKLEDLNTCSDLITKHGAALQRALSDLEQLNCGDETSAKIKSVNERATLFRITSNAMINVSQK